MINIQRHIKSKKNIRRFIYSYITFFIILAIALTFIFDTLKFLEKRSKINKNTEILNGEIMEIENKIMIKREELETLKTDSGQEKYFRETFPLAKDGENVIILYSKESDFAENVSTSTKETLFENVKNKYKFFIKNYTNL